LFKRYDVKKGKSVPHGAIPCQEPDTITGHWPHWVMVDNSNPADKWFFEALEDPNFDPKDGTYELCGPKVQGNPEGFPSHQLVRHGVEKMYFSDYSFDFIKKLIDELPFEGIVFHHPDGRMCKIRKSDFGIKRFS